MTIHLTTLSNGLRVITDTVPTVDSVAVGVWAGVGTRNEDPDFNGVAHMVEHMMFKGTTTRTARDIAEQAEAVGAHMNAYTGRETTAYHIQTLKEDVSLALDLLSDILQNSILAEEEVARERHVIIQEIGTAHDTPDDLVFDLYQETAYRGQTLGAPVLGRADAIARMPRAALVDYIGKYYTPGRLVISAAGNIAHEEMLRMVRERFDSLSHDRPSDLSPASYTGGERREERDLEQAHFVLGFRGLARTDPDYYVANALSTLLGGGMSSRLFQEIREKRGLVYSIYSFHQSFVDDGQFAIYAGTGPEDLPTLTPILCDCLRAVTADVGARELARAKAQMRAGLLMGRESMLGRADQQARHLLTFGAKIEIPEILEKIDSVTRENVIAMAQRIFSGTPTLAALGPLAHLEEYSGLTGRLAA
ncbi:MAG: insulinase family protein [Rhodospirillales bacterium]|nr:insulinase family protein [Rhodospirillales bacterium]